MSTGYNVQVKPRLLVVGARHASLGAAVANAGTNAGFDVYTAGIFEEGIKLDAVLDSDASIVQTLMGIQPHHVISTVGINMPKPQKFDADVAFDWYRWHFETNVTANMKLLTAYQTAVKGFDYAVGTLYHYAAVGSNSSRIPRTASAAYCASKAALAMAVRCEAREAARIGSSVVAYGYEPGLLAGTPMTRASEDRFGDVKLTRMEGPGLSRGIDPHRLARFMVRNLDQGREVNGLMFPYDADEL